MDKRDIFKSVYDDFFGVESLSRRNEELSEEIEKLSENIGISKTEEVPTIKVDTSKVNKDELMKELFEKIDNLYIDDKSKELLKKIIEYMRKYDEKIEKQYISFNMSIYSDNKETVDDIINILVKAGVQFSYIREGRGATYTLYDIEEVNQIESMYDQKNCVVALKDFESLENKEKVFKDRFVNKLEEIAKRNENQVLTVLIAKNKELLGEGYKDFKDFEIKGINPDVQDAYNDVLSKIKENMEITDDFTVKLLDYISVTYPNNNLSYPEYRDNLTQKIIFNKEIPEYEKEKTMDEIFEELNNLVGLGKVKQMIKDLVNLIELKNKTKDDLKLKNINLHMIFLGNPGTGKTTVARIIAEMLYNLKYVKQNKLIEVSSKDLVAEYVGQTAPKTMAVVQKALGGVLFVDEAYSLASRSRTRKFI